MTAQQLVRLYPPAWKARYRDEFVAMIGSDRLHVQQVVDIVSGAIDAWLSTEVGRGDVAAAGVQEEKTMRVLPFVCVDARRRFSMRDGLIAGIVLILATTAFVVAEQLARQAGLPLIAATLHSIATPTSLAVSMPLWALKGQKRRVQLAVVAATICFALFISLA